MRVQLVGVDVVELAVDVVDRDAHDEDRDEDVQQHAQLDQRRHLADQRDAERVDAVLQHDVAQDLVMRLAPADDQEEARSAWSCSAAGTISEDAAGPGRCRRRAEPQGQHQQRHADQDATGV